MQSNYPITLVWDQNPYTVATVCTTCRAPLNQPKSGRPRRTCSDACRQKKHRREYEMRHAQQLLWRADLRRANRKLAQLERQYGPLDDTPPKRGVSLRATVHYQLYRGWHVFTCRVCDRPVNYRPYNGLGLIYCSHHCKKIFTARRAALRRTTTVRFLGREYTADEFDLERRGYLLEVCAHCKGTFVPHIFACKPTQYCSKACRQAAWYRRKHGQAFGRRKCAECNKVFAARQYGHLYCGLKCRSRFNERKRGAPKLKTPVRPACMMCGAAMTARSTRGKWRRQTCSARCKRAYYRLQKAQEKAAKLGILPTFVTKQEVGNVEISEALR